MENQYYYKLMASYLSKRNCDESFMRYFFGKNAAKKTPEELERADERKRRLQRERSRRYRALKNARRHGGGSEGSEAEARGRRSAAALEDELSDCDEPPTLCDLSLLDDKWRDASDASDDAAPPSPAAIKLTPNTDFALTLKEFLSSPNAELEPSTVHTLMFHWLQT